MRGVVLGKSRDFEIVQDADGVHNTGAKKTGGVGGKKGYIYSSSGDFLVQVVRYDAFDSYPAFRWLTNTKQPSLLPAQPPGTSWTTSLKTRFSTCGEDSLRCWTFLLCRKPLLTLRPHASRSKQSSSQVDLTVQPSNKATNTPSGGRSTHNWCHRIENTWLFNLWCF